MQSVGEHFCRVFTRHGAGKRQPALAQDALIRVGAQEPFPQHSEPRLLRFRVRRHRQCFVDFRQQRATSAVGQKAVGESDVLPVTVEQNVLLLGALEAAATAGFGFASLARE